MTDRIDLMDLQRKRVDAEELKKQYGLTDDHFNRLQKVHILTFYHSEKDKKLVMATLDNGGVVFRHHHGGQMIQAGETWIVEVEQKKTTFFAKGLVKLDSQFFFDLRVDQVDVIADTIWKKYRSIIEPLLEERYKEYLQEILEKEIQAEHTKEIQKFKTQIKELKKKNKKQLEKFKQLKEKVGKKKTKKKTTVKKEVSTPEKPRSQSFFQKHEEMMHPVIRRIKPDVLESPQFTKDHYFVHISSDQSIMTIIPHKGGPIPCVDNQLHLQGLGLISEYGGPYNMSAEYSPKYGGYVVYLKYTPSSMSGSD